MKLLGTISVEQFVSLVPDEPDRSLKTTVDVQGTQINMRITTPRLVTLRRNINCNACGVEGTIVRVEENDMDPHMNVYTDDGSMLSATYITPKSQGGSEEPYNRQTLCNECLHKKQQGKL